MMLGKAKPDGLRSNAGAAVRGTSRIAETHRCTALLTPLLAENAVD